MTTTSPPLAPTLLVLAALALPLALAPGCTAPTAARSRPVGHASTLTGDLRDPRTLPMFEGGSGSPIGWEALVARSSYADVVLIGEAHGHPLGGAVSVALFTDILSNPSAGGSAALSLEFFERDQQARLDDYLTDVIDEKTFRHVTGRTGSTMFGPGNYPDAHRDMLEAAKSAQRPVIAANAPRRYVTLSREESYDRIRSLSQEQRRLYVVPDALTSGPYEDRFFEDMSRMMAEHMPAQDASDADPENQEDVLQEKIQGYYRAQNVWDATMADSVASALRDGSRPVVHVVGQFHVDSDGGLFQRLRADAPGARILTISLAQDHSESLLEDDRDRADIVVYVGTPGH